PAERAPVGVTPRLELLEVCELAHVDLAREMTADRLLERLAGRELAARERPRPGERVERPLPEQDLELAGAHLEHDRDDGVGRRFRLWIGNHVDSRREVIDFEEKTSR